MPSSKRRGVAPSGLTIPECALTPPSATLTQRVRVRENLGPDLSDAEGEIWALSCGESHDYRERCIRACLEASVATSPCAAGGDGPGGAERYRHASAQAEAEAEGYVVSDGGNASAGADESAETLARPKAPKGGDAARRAAEAMQKVVDDKIGGGLVRCGRCRSEDVSIEARQTRSADEGMTLFMQCLRCQNRWKG